MANVPNIVRERLRAEAAESGHPEANVLSAFAEDSLSVRERREVIDHLARCGECREVVALALPETVPAEVVAKPAPVRWLAWPALRWGFAVAGIIIVGSFAALQYRNREQARSVAKFVAPSEVRSTAAPAASTNAAAGQTPSNQALSDQVSKQEVPKATPALQKDAESRTTSGNLLARNSAVPEQRVTAPASAHGANAFRGNAGGVVSAGRPFFGPRIPAPGQQQQQASQYAQTLGGPLPATNPQGTITNTTPAPTTVTVEVSGEAPLVETQTANNTPAQKLQGQNPQGQSLQGENLDMQAQNLQAASSAAPAAQLSDDDASRFSRAKAPTAPQPIRAPVAEFPRWNINADGKLQRSLDRGLSWHDIDVTATSALVPALNAMDLKSSTAAPAEVAELAAPRKADKALAKKQAAPPVFRVVVADGMEVWAGGTAGALYHSVDAGDHWMRIVPSDGGVTLASDIVSIAFPDAQHGQITTATSNTWVTDDAGKTWRKR